MLTRLWPTDERWGLTRWRTHLPHHWMPDRKKCFLKSFNSTSLKDSILLDIKLENGDNRHLSLHAWRVWSDYWHDILGMSGVSAWLCYNTLEWGAASGAGNMASNEAVSRIQEAAAGVIITPPVMSGNILSSITVHCYRRITDILWVKIYINIGCPRLIKETLKCDWLKQSFLQFNWTFNKNFTWWLPRLRHWPGASDMDINPYIGNKTHFINSLLGPQFSRPKFVFTIFREFQTIIVLARSPICPCFSKRRKRSDLWP